MKTWVLGRNGSVVEHVLGKDGVEGPIPSCGTISAFCALLELGIVWSEVPLLS